MKRLARHWSDNDRYIGPLTVARCGFARIGLMLDSGNDEYRGASVRAHFWGYTVVLAIPSFLPLGREYGAFLSRGYLYVHYGSQTMDSSTEKSRCWRVPWLNWRHVRTSIYGLSGEHVATENGRPWLEWYEIKGACPSVAFEFFDFDGERLTARTIIEENEWRLGTGLFRWLSAFRRPRVIRSLDIMFSCETGRQKGSWKGGTIGHGIEILPNELHESAFRRYCAEHEMAFIAVAPASPGAGEQKETAHGT